MAKTEKSFFSVMFGITEHLDPLEEDLANEKTLSFCLDPGFKVDFRVGKNPALSEWVGIFLFVNGKSIGFYDYSLDMVKVLLKLKFPNKEFKILKNQIFCKGATILNRGSLLTDGTLYFWKEVVEGCEAQIRALDNIMELTVKE